MIGADISKSATAYAAKRDKLSQYITANSYKLPVSDKSADIILSLFAPTPAEEFKRILAPGGSGHISATISSSIVAQTMTLKCTSADGGQLNIYWKAAQRN